MKKIFYQIKLSGVGTKNISTLFKTFSLESILKKSGIIKNGGHSIQDMFFCMLILILENSKSLHGGIVQNFR